MAPSSDLEALHVLAADVDDEVHVGQEMPGSGEVGHRLHHAVVGMERGLGKVLPVAGGGHGGHMRDAGCSRIELLEHLPDQRHGVAQVGAVMP